MILLAITFCLYSIHTITVIVLLHSIHFIHTITFYSYYYIDYIIAKNLNNPAHTFFRRSMMKKDLEFEKIGLVWWCGYHGKINNVKKCIKKCRRLMRVPDSYRICF